MARRTIDGGAPERQSNPFTRYRTNTFAASERNLTAVVERNAGKNQHSVRGIHIIAAIFTNCGYRLLAFNVRRLHVQA
ncbi:Uncharacterised protein [Salmonella enterica subsp. enterica serovar Bovismorbificans]|uniref:Uncharacterized protein n=1 Tax=Salmonella enterica subsp. enterica serovar Bovismorbificans TaxID=58097 RepID=A0A655BMC4_SALET|nr:Uncharacterised protein [Salmonella enterica subsp. enterica serovar Bovismorbificans]